MTEISDVELGLSTVMSVLLSAKPHAEFRQGLVDQPEQALMNFAFEQTRYHPGEEVSAIRTAAESVLKSKLDMFIASNDAKIRELEQRLGKLVAKNDELKAIRSNFQQEGEK
jgi:hypothetical protein